MAQSASDSVANTKKPRNVESLNDHREFCFSAGESITFDQLLQNAIKLGVGVVADPKSDPDDLAVYDRLNNVIWIPAATFKQAHHDSEFKRTIAHELVHAKQNQLLLEQALDSESRKKLVARQAQSMSEEDYVKLLWNGELEAERAAWIIYFETVNTYGKRQGEKAFDTSFLKGLADEKAGEFTDQKRAAYEKQFREAYRKLTAGKQR